MTRAPGDRAAHADGVVRRLGARVREEDLLDRRDVVPDPLREPDLELHRADADDVDLLERLVDALLDPRIGVAEDHRPEGVVVVDVLVAVGVPDARALRPDEDARRVHGAQTR